MRWFNSVEIALVSFVDAYLSRVYKKKYADELYINANLYLMNERKNNA